MDELEVPEEALRAGRLLSFGNGITELEIRVIAAPVLVADYRRLLDNHEPWELLQAIHDRIAELDGS